MWPVDDETLLEALGGDAKAKRVLGRWLTRELGCFYARYSDGDLAMELSQRTAMELLAKIKINPELQNVEALRDCLRRFGVVQARREATQKKRMRERAAKLAVHLVEQDLEPPVSIETSLGDAEQRALLEELLEALPKPMRKSLELRRQGHTYASIAKKMQVSETTASRIVENALQRLEREYERARKTRPEFRSAGKAS